MKEENKREATTLTEAFENAVDFACDEMGLYSVVRFWNNNHNKEFRVSVACGFNATTVTKFPYYPQKDFTYSEIKRRKVLKNEN